MVLTVLKCKGHRCSVIFCPVCVKAGISGQCINRLFVFCQSIWSHDTVVHMSDRGTIYIDFDDVLCETALELAQIVEQEFGRRVAFEDIQAFDLEKSFDLNREQWEHMMELAHRPEVLAHLAPIKGAAEVLRTWNAAGYNLDVVTGRPSASHEASGEWLARYGIPFDSLTFVDKYARTHVVREGKDVLTLDELASRDYVLAVDDAPRMLTYLSETMCVPLLVFDRPWNAGWKSGATVTAPVHRCRSWEQIACNAAPVLDAWEKQEGCHV